ncbi:hypothetical protein [Streptococcus merionis]|uniref:hypothetical protein n=1 Tax=Streptococcus merionis TaxID=400065 RepID=UPI003514D8C7
MLHIESWLSLIQMDLALADTDFKARHKKRALPDYGFAHFVIGGCLNQETYHFIKVD